MKRKIYLIIFVSVILLFAVSRFYRGWTAQAAIKTYDECTLQYWRPETVPQNTSFWVDALWVSPQHPSQEWTSTGPFVSGAAGYCTSYSANSPSSWNCAPGTDKMVFICFTYPAPACTLAASPSSGTAPLSGTLTWTTENSPTSCTASGGWSGSKSASGGSEKYKNVNSTTTYDLTCQNDDGLGNTQTGSCSATVTITGTPTPTPTPTPSCKPATFNSATSKVTPSSVSPSGAYTLTCDYGVVTNAIFPVAGSGTCSWNGFTGTVANFNCTAGATLGTYNNSCALANIDPDFYCAQTNSINQLTVTVPNATPAPSNVTVTEPNYCASSPAATVSWTYSDPDGDPQSAYQAQIDDQPSFSSPEIDTGKVTSASTSVFLGQGILQFNATYQARVRVWDSKGAVSSWVVQSLCNGPGCI